MGLKKQYIKLSLSQFWKTRWLLQIWSRGRTHGVSGMTQKLSLGLWDRAQARSSFRSPSGARVGEWNNVWPPSLSLSSICVGCSLCRLNRLLLLLTFPKMKWGGEKWTQLVSSETKTSQGTRKKWSASKSGCLWGRGVAQLRGWVRVLQPELPGSVLTSGKKINVKWTFSVGI